MFNSARGMCRESSWVQYWLQMMLEAHMAGLTSASTVTVPVYVRTEHPRETASPHALRASTSLFLAAIVLSLKLLCHSGKLYSLC